MTATPTAISALSNDLRDRLKRYALAHTGDEATADDVTQEVLLRLWQALQRDDAPEQPLGWVLRAARNRIVDDARRAARQATLASDAFWAGVQSREGDAAAGASDPAGLAGCLQSAIDQLPAEYAEVLRRVDLLQHDRRTVARELGISDAALKARVVRGRRQLHGLLSACCRFSFTADGRLDEMVPHTATSHAADAACHCGTSGTSSASSPPTGAPRTGETCTGGNTP